MCFWSGVCSVTIFHHAPKNDTQAFSPLELKTKRTADRDAPPRDELDDGLRRRQGPLEVADVPALVHEAQAAVGHVPLEAVRVKLRVQDLVLSVVSVVN